MRSRILFISGRHEDARRLSQMLLASPLFLDHVETLLQARAKLQQEDYQVVLTEAALPDGDWLDALHLARESPHEPEVIVTDPLADAAFGPKRSTWRIRSAGAALLRARGAPHLNNACSRPASPNCPAAAA